MPKKALTSGVTGQDGAYLAKLLLESGGTMELIREGFNGFLYTPGDYKELAQKILYLYEHPEQAKQIGKNAQKWVAEQFTEERYGEEVLAILKQFTSIK